MNINSFLKRIKKTKTDLAPELGISRPTLNQYIDLYENGENIENDRYNIIFSRLFSNPDMSRAEFDNQLQSVKFLLERDRKYDIGSLAPEAADLVADIHNRMIADMSEEKWEKKVYDAINIILSQYKAQPIIRELMCYFSDLNSDSNLEDLAEDSKAYYSYYYSAFRKIVDNPPQLDKAEYESFLLRKVEISKARETKANEITKNIEKRIADVIKMVELEYQKRGIEVSEEEILNEVVRRITR